MRRLAHIAHSFAIADSTDQVVESLEGICRASGLSVWAVGRPAFKPASDEEIAQRVTFGHDVSDKFRADWRAEYRRQGSGIITRHMATNPGPITYTEALRLLQPSHVERGYFDLFRDHGLRDALCCGDGRRMVVYVADRALTATALSHETRLALAAAAGMAVARLKELDVSPPVPPELSERQKTVLIRLSEGLTIPEIAAHLGISEPSVKTFIQRAARKLGAKSQLHAVAVALRQRLI